MNAEKLYREIINNMQDGVYFTDKERMVTFWNCAAEEITGYSKEDILGKKCPDTPLKHIDGEGRLICDLACPLYDTLMDGQPRKHNAFVKHKEGYRIPISINIFPIKEEEEIVGAVEIFAPNAPIVYEAELIDNLSNSAMSDPLTGIANRRKIETYLDFRLKEMKTFHNKFCVIFLDIDDYRVFNDTYGHYAGDAVLVSISKSIMHTIRSNDLFGRWGGEEFVGIFTVTKESDVIIIAEKIRALIEKTEIQHEGKQLSVTASLGVTIVRDGDTVDSIIKRVDPLMYKSKQNGKNCITFDEKQN
jgi:diguanylate cyclase (GGDEF)-like protein/PAS domain S-box-containing protein